jgi:hypothetical protein
MASLLWGREAVLEMRRAERRIDAPVPDDDAFPKLSGV